MSTAGQTITETEKSSDLGEISAVTVRIIAADRLFNAHYFSVIVVP